MLDKSTAHGTHHIAPVSRKESPKDGSLYKEVTFPSPQTYTATSGSVGATLYSINDMKVTWVVAQDGTTGALIGTITMTMGIGVYGWHQINGNGPILTLTLISEGANNGPLDVWNIGALPTTDCTYQGGLLTFTKQFTPNWFDQLLTAASITTANTQWWKC